MDRKQTLVNCERYITPELKTYEEKILNAEEGCSDLETTLFNDLVLSLNDYMSPVQIDALVIAKIDCLLSFARVSAVNNYKRPLINDGFTLNIKGGRHPVIEKNLAAREEYISNDVLPR